ncbi:MAG: hypothetical protein LBG14_03265 [Treponema sp.]|nr:hypothetical protein [Treponema sp.]
MEQRQALANVTGPLITPDIGAKFMTVSGAAIDRRLGRNQRLPMRHYESRRSP